MALSNRFDINLYDGKDSPVTVADLRKLLKTLDAFNVTDDTVLDECNIYIGIDVDPEGVDAIDCGDCIYGYNDAPHDVVLTVHACLDGPPPRP